MNKLIVFWILLLLGVLIVSCEKILPSSPKDEDVLDGALHGLSSQELRQFIKGDVAFNDEIFTPQTGLGPLFVANSCGSCHPGDGKGHPFSTLTRFGQTDSNGNLYFAEGAPQLQHRAIPGYNPESLPSNVSSTKILAPANTGLGFLDAVSDADILAMADPFDADGDGISGVPNWINAPNYIVHRANVISQNNKHIGRFGKKASAYDLLHQTANAYNQDMGVNTIFEPYDTYSKLEVDPEVSNATVYDVVFYLKTLKAPIQRNADNSDVILGKQIFVNINCNKCHKEELKTSSSFIAALSYQTFYPYTDMLLHDMGPGLDDNYTEGAAKTNEWRTPALWGLGLSTNSQGGTYFLMHDGRARSLKDAILLHGGESTQSKQAYESLSESDKQKLIIFLESL